MRTRRSDCVVNVSVGHATALAESVPMFLHISNIHIVLNSKQKGGSSLNPSSSSLLRFEQTGHLWLRREAINAVYIAYNCDPPMAPKPQASKSSRDDPAGFNSPGNAPDERYKYVTMLQNGKHLMPCPFRSGATHPCRGRSSRWGRGSGAVRNQSKRAKRYPTPGSVRRSWGFAGSASSFSRR
jgi:hypothetical protein